ncbi:hypothetical protein C7410_101328 [Paraburkholderia silvatlantica]|uniref:Phage integrase family protein n=1 Tax=Paraburkholderia silvatlantica TaxID=321895 RepID=A0A2V4V5Q3_9BURK|nr:hypothetical protein [Paraburkholderia silvatlantica]PYE27996.1 hypothetical protein C7410_101328 [Paraburkholderia silvatlantica]
MHAIRVYQGAFETKCALLIGMLTFVRPGGLRKAEWTEFDLAQDEWRMRDAMLHPYIQLTEDEGGQSTLLLEAQMDRTGARADLRPAHVGLKLGATIH